MTRIRRLLVGCATVLAVVAPATPALAATEVTMLNLMFQGYTENGRANDTSGRNHPGYPVTGGGGKVRVLARADGQAAQFPAPCRAGGGHKCPRAILQIASHPDLNPGTRNFRYGAMVMLRPAETSAGSNVVQKGFYTSVAQWKLQVDGKGGRPSCVLARSGNGYKITAGVSVADGAWHRVECRRADRDLSILVDGVPRGRIGLPDQMNISNSEPVRVGGKAASQNNDQFFGAVDNVFLAVG